MASRWTLRSSDEWDQLGMGLGLLLGLLVGTLTGELAFSLLFGAVAGLTLGEVLQRRAGGERLAWGKRSLRNQLLLGALALILAAGVALALRWTVR
jgi:hypothetical protein